MIRSTSYTSPYHWWGPGPAPVEPLSIQALVRTEAIDISCAATLWASLAHHKSLTVIGGPSGLGKSTLLHALLPALAAGTQRVYLRGCYETFAFQDQPGFSPDTTALLANEISPHLPFYLWGPAVLRMLEAGEAGCQLLATAHGRDVVEFAASLTGSPLRIPAHLLSRFGLVALMEPGSRGERGQVSGLWQLSATRAGVAIDQLGPDDLPADISSRQVAAARATILQLLTQD